MCAFFATRSRVASLHQNIVVHLKRTGVAGGHGFALRDTYRLAGDRGPGEALFGADQQYPAEAVQLQRDPQSPCSAGHYLRAVHSGAAGDTAPCRRDAGVLAQMRYDHSQGGRAPLQVLSRRQRAAQVSDGDFTRL